MAIEFPRGVVALVFTDIEGSSDLWEQHRAAFQPALEAHNRLLREAVARWNGFEVKTIGDAFMLVFAKPANAVQWAIDVQRSLAHHDWPQEIGALRVRIGIHVGEPQRAQHPDGAWDFFGPPVNRAARVEAAGHGGQVLVTNPTRELAAPGLPGEIGFKDHGAHRLKGVGEEQLWQVQAPDLMLEFPPLKTLRAQSHNLPLPTTPFVGREAEIAAWCDLLLQPTTRLLSLVGFGGMGKTRAALQMAEICAQDYADRFPDGVWWVELEEAREAEAMLQRIATQLQLRLEPQPGVREQLVNHLHQRQLLLVLDNAEQIANAGLTVLELLNAAANVKCLLTTRRPLGLRIERLVEVPQLPVADAQALFVERAQARQADFAITESNARDVAELCRRLGGVPLAIELAASRIVGMTPHEVLDRIDERLRLLQTRNPDLPPRQRGLRGAIDWSYDLLGEEDKQLFAQLAVFAGGFTLPAAEAVCVAADTLEGVMELRNHSFLQSSTDRATQQTLFEMPEAVRAYAAEKLEEQADAAAQLKQRHAAHFLRYAEQRIAQLDTRDEAQALNELQLKFDNLQAAMLWAQQCQRVESCAQLALCLCQLCYRRGFWSEAQQCLQAGWQTLHEGGEVASASSERRALVAAIAYQQASLAHDMGDLPEARSKANACLVLRRELQERSGEADALNLLGLLALEAGDQTRARQLLEEALALLANNDHHRRGKALHNLAQLAAQRRDPETARRLYAETLAHRRAAGDARGEALTLGNLGVLAHRGGEWAAARDFYQESLAQRQTLSDRLGIAVLLNNLAELAEAAQDAATAIALYVHAERIFRELQSHLASEPSWALQRLSKELGTRHWVELRLAADETSWEELVTRRFEPGTTK